MTVRRKIAQPRCETGTSLVDIANEDPEYIKWKIFIHMTFLGSAILLAWTDKIMQKERTH
jgi:uncharacterized membrane protein YqhA